MGLFVFFYSFSDQKLQRFCVEFSYAAVLEAEILRVPLDFSDDFTQFLPFSQHCPFASLAEDLGAFFGLLRYLRHC